MAPCESCRENLLEYLYGLLDEGAAQELEQHLLKCEPCRAHLEEAKREQGLLSQAAHVVRTVEPFSAPGSLVAEETTTAVAPAPSSAPVETETTEATPQTLPLDPAPRRRSMLRRYWPAWAAAAAILAAFLGGQLLYQQGFQAREQALAQSRKTLETLDAKFASLQKELTVDQLRTEKDLVGPAVHVHAMGPTQYHPAVPAVCRIATRDVNGKPAKATVTLRVLDQKEEVLFEKKAQSEGEVALTIPAGLDLTGGIKGEGKAEKKAKLVLETTSGTFTERMEEPLRAAPVTHTTHIALNKNTFSVGEVLFFRTLTLDRVSHQPAPETLPLKFSLLNDQGREVYALAGATGPGGICAGNFALTEDLPSGAYTVLVQAEEKSKEKVLPQAHYVNIVGIDGLEIEFDRAAYKAGEVVNVWARSKGAARLNRGTSEAKKKAGDAKADPKADPKQNTYDLRISVDGKLVPALNAGAYTPDLAQKVTLDALGNAVVQFKLPKRIERGDVVVELEKRAGAGVERYVQPVPVVPSELAVDFFPEGGELVPGVTNKVYYRVRSPAGAPVDPSRLVVRSSTGEVLLQSEKSGLGCFNFVPRGKDRYEAQLDAPGLPGGKAAIHEPFKGLPLVTDGVAFHVKQPVGAAGEAIDFILRNPGPKRRLLLVATCRGVVFDQQVLSIEGKKQEKSGRLEPPKGVDGLLRLTLLELAGEEQEGLKVIRPLAERLVFRSPARHLSVTYDADKNPQPGQKLNLNIDIQDENSKPASAWMLASVVDEKAISPFSEAGLPAYFQIGPGVAQGQDLDLAFVRMSGEKKDAARALDLFLGTHGWRRFAPDLNQDLIALRDRGEWKFSEKKDVEKKEADRAVLPVPIFSRESRSLIEQRVALQGKLIAKLEESQTKALNLRTELAEERERTLLAARSAAEELQRYETGVKSLAIQVTLGLIVLLLIAGSLVGLLLALHRYIRSQPVRTQVGFSCVCSAVALCIWLGFARSLPEITSSVDRGQLAWIERPRPWPQLEMVKPEEVVPPLKAMDSPFVGPFALKASEALDAEEERRFPEWGFLPPVTVARTALAEGVTGEKDSQQKALDQLGRSGKSNLLTTSEGSRFEPVPLEPLFQNEELQERYRVASKAQRLQLESGEKGKKDRGSETQTTTLPALRPSYAAGVEPSDRTTKISPKNYDDAFKQDRADLDLLVREYNYRAFPLRPHYQPTVLWHPALVVENGTATLSFDLSPEVSAYRVLLIGNSDSGRLGFCEGRLQVQGENAKK